MWNIKQNRNFNKKRGWKMCSLQTIPPMLLYLFAVGYAVISVCEMIETKNELTVCLFVIHIYLNRMVGNLSKWKYFRRQKIMTRRIKMINANKGGCVWFHPESTTIRFKCWHKTLSANIHLHFYRIRYTLLLNKSSTISHQIFPLQIICCRFKRKK